MCSVSLSCGALCFISTSIWIQHLSSSHLRTVQHLRNRKTCQTFVFPHTSLHPSLEPVLVVPPAWDSPTTWLVVFTHQPPSHDGCAAFKSTGNPMKASALPSPLYPPCWLVLSCCCWQPASWYQNNQTSPSSTAGPGPRPSKAPPRVLWPGSVLQSTVSVCSPYLIFFFPLQQDDERLI